MQLLCAILTVVGYAVLGLACGGLLLGLATFLYARTKLKHLEGLDPSTLSENDRDYYAGLHQVLSKDMPEFPGKVARLLGWIVVSVVVIVITKPIGFPQ